MAEMNNSDIGVASTMFGSVCGAKVAASPYGGCQVLEIVSAQSGALVQRSLSSYWIKEDGTVTHLLVLGVAPERHYALVLDGLIANWPKGRWIPGVLSRVGLPSP